jgi:hypothetical protein
MHCFGIDRAVNDAFLKSLARITGGRCALMTPQDDIPSAVEKLAVTLRRPVLTGLRLEGDAETPNETARLPDLCAGEVLLTAVRLADAAATSLRITGTLANGSPHTVTFDLSAARPDAETPMPRLLWAHRRIRHLQETGHQPEAIQHAIAHNLTCRGAAFVAWDEAEKVPVARREVVQPSLDIGKCVASVQKHASCMIPAGAALDSHAASGLPDVMHFFEGKVTDYQRASQLQMCSDEELVADFQTTDSLEEDDVCYSLAPPAGVGHFQSNMLADPGPDAVLPRPVRQLFERHRYTYGHFHASEDDTSTPLAAWTHRFARLLSERAALPEAVARLVALMLRHWALETISTQRQRLLETWLAELPQAPDFLPALRAALSAAPQTQVLQDATELLETALAHPVKEKRSWFGGVKK